LSVVLKGPTGCGKTRFLEAMAHDLDRPLITVACHDDLTTADLVGRFLLRGGETEWVDGPLTRAVREGAICYLDEVVEARQDTTVVLHPLADHRRQLPIERLGLTIDAAPGFCLVVSYNPGYQSVLKDLKDSTRQRMVAIEFGFPPAPVEEKIVAHEAGIAPEVNAKIQAGLKLLERLGCELVEVELPHTEYAIACYYVVAMAEASSNLARFDGVRYGLRVHGEGTLTGMYRETRDAGFGNEVKRRIILGTFVLSSGYYDAYYLKAQKVRTLIKQDFEKALAQVDVIASPTSPTPPFRLGEKSNDPLAMYLSDIFTITANLAGIPGISVPCGKTVDGLPIGLQLLGKHFDESTLLRIGHAFETAGGFTL
jgi:nitric oxide reductase NorQ protein